MPKPRYMMIAFSLMAVGEPALANHSAFSNFTPLTGSIAAGSLPEPTPLLLSSSRFSQKTVSANDAGPLNGGVKLGDNWDMNTVNETGPSAGRYMFSPYETGTAGVRRLDLQTNQAATIVPSGAQGFVSGDASRWTPWGTYLTAEESWGTGSTKGRLFEITNPLAPVGAINFVSRNVLPRVAHEGLTFDKAGNLYFVDENSGGSIYKYVSQTPNAPTFFDAGQTFVLKVGAGNNSGATGAAAWVPITDTAGNPLPGIATVTIAGATSIDGRAAADQVGGTNFNRPEDLEVQTLSDGTQAIYFAATGTHNVFSIKLTGANSAQVNLAVDRTTINKATGTPVGTEFDSPDNLAIDADGNIYIVEDQPAGVADIWFMADLDRNGIAESIGRWASLSTAGSEPTGLYFDPFNPNVAYLNVQHTDSDVDRTLQITAAVPEPSTAPLALLGLGVLGFAAYRRNNR